MKDLILKGKLYRAVTPLYIVRYDKKEEYFFTDKELEDWKLKPNCPKKYDIIRAKG